MAHPNLHVAVGLGLGGFALAVPLARAWLAGRPVARPIARLLVVSYALALWAIVPSALTALGLAGDAVHRAWWADVFVLHATIDRRTDSGLLIGEVAIAAMLAAQYALCVLGIVRARRRGVKSPS